LPDRVPLHQPSAHLEVSPQETLRWSYAAPDLAGVTRRFDAFIAECKTSPVPELHRLARTALR
jgi:hypothetical protein